jgi:hypothetical protein
MLSRIYLRTVILTFAALHALLKNNRMKQQNTYVKTQSLVAILTYMFIEYAKAVTTNNGV